VELLTQLRWVVVAEHVLTTGGLDQTAATAYLVHTQQLAAAQAAAIPAARLLLAVQAAALGNIQAAAAHQTQQAHLGKVIVAELLELTVVVAVV
jgi:hypothetical protein